MVRRTIFPFIVPLWINKIFFFRYFYLSWYLVIIEKSRLFEKIKEKDTKSHLKENKLQI